MAGFFVRRGSKTIGPVSSSRLRALVTSGKIQRSDQIGNSEDGPWQLAGEVSGLFTDSTTPAFGPAPTDPPVATIGGGRSTTTRLLVFGGVAIAVLCSVVAITVVAFLPLGALGPVSCSRKSILAPLVEV